jgi:hypothetical protein
MDNLTINILGKYSILTEYYFIECHSFCNIYFFLTFNTLFFEGVIVTVTGPIFGNPAMNNFAASRAFTAIPMMLVSTLTASDTLTSMGMPKQKTQDVHFTSLPF